MRDEEIVDLYWQRDETAIQETDIRYGKYLLTIAENILNNEEDSREVVNDTYYRAWCTMPDNRPKILSLYLGKIAREKAVDLWRSRHRKKREASEYAVSLSELEDCVSGEPTPEEKAEERLLSEVLNRFLESLSKEDRAAFLGRYYYAYPIRSIAGYLHMSESGVKKRLKKLRLKLKELLTAEGFHV